jgi:hypothetical protein
MSLLELPTDVRNLLPIYSHKDLISLRNTCKLLNRFVRLIIKNWEIKIYSHIHKSYKYQLKYYTQCCFEQEILFADQLRIFSEYVVLDSNILVFPKAPIRLFIGLLQNLYPKDTVFNASFSKDGNTYTVEELYKFDLFGLSEDYLTMNCFEGTRWNDQFYVISLQVSLNTPLEEITCIGRKSFLNALNSKFFQHKRENFTNLESTFDDSWN